MKSSIKVSPVNIENRAKLGIRPGDTVRVWQKIQEKGKTRLQAFEGFVLARKHGNEPGATFTVRRVTGSVGVEKIYPLYSPMIDKIEITKRSKVRRAKLYYIREKVAREIRRQMRKMTMMHLASESEVEQKAKAEADAAKAEEAAAAETEEKKEDDPKDVVDDSKDEKAEEEAPVAEEKEKPKEDDPKEEPKTEGKKEEEKDSKKE